MLECCADCASDRRYAELPALWGHALAGVHTGDAAFGSIETMLVAVEAFWFPPTWYHCSVQDPAWVPVPNGSVPFITIDGSNCAGSPALTSVHVAVPSGFEVARAVPWPEAMTRVGAPTFVPKHGETARPLIKP